MPDHATTPAASRDPLYRRISAVHEELLERDGDAAAQTFLDLLEACAPDQGRNDWETLLRDGIAALKHGDWEKLRARLAEPG